MRKMIAVSLLSATAIAAAASSAQAAGFYLQEQSVKGQGAAFAGAAANPQDASIIFNNPSALTSLDSGSLVAGTSIIVPHATLDNRGSTAGPTAGAQAAYGGPNSENPFGLEAVPSFYAAHPLTQDKSVWLGLGVNAPFGLGNEYAEDWFGRYDSTQSELKTIDIAPVIAAKLNERISIGGGPNIQYANAMLETALPCPVGAGCGAAFSPTTDGKQRLQGKSWSVGYNAGLFVKAAKDTDIGLHYRSGINQTIDGSNRVTGLAGALAGQNGTRLAKAKLKLPDIASVAVSHRYNERLKLLGSYTWFNWSNFNEIRVKFDTGGADAVIPQSYQNSYSVALGGEWKHNDRLTLRAGTQFDKTPTTDNERSTRTPDSNRYWLSVGASYAISDSLSIDAAASHIFMEDGDINVSRRFYAGSGVDSTVNVRSNVESSINIASIQAVWKF
jgi:long-chain fatty acid transport protein